MRKEQPGTVYDDQPHHRAPSAAQLRSRIVQLASTRSSSSSLQARSTDVSCDPSSDAPTRRGRAPTTAMAPPPPPAPQFKPAASNLIPADQEDDFSDYEGDLSILYEEENSVQTGKIANMLGDITDNVGEYFSSSFICYL